MRSARRARLPDAGLVLGSGLGGLAHRIDDARSVPYAALPGFAVPSVPGHEGRLIAGTLGDRHVEALAGRFHVYEGQSPGGLMVIRDHINLSWRNPLIGPVQPGDERFPDMSDPYDPALRALLAESAAALGMAVEEGVYVALAGPSYETPAEVRMLQRLGADAVGMSTVHEVIVARAMGMRVAGVSCITNRAAGLGGGPVSHTEVLQMTDGAAGRFEALAVEFIRRLP
jgi:purine nucleoside phosphorylase